MEEDVSHTGEKQPGIIFGWIPKAAEKNKCLKRLPEIPAHHHTSETLASKRARVLVMKNFEILWDLSDCRKESNTQKLSRESCCKYWNLGFDCGPFHKAGGRSCTKHHICSHDRCRALTDTDHRAIQHSPRPLCQKDRGKLLGMNKLHPTPLRFHEKSSPEDTLKACKQYGVKPPPLNWQIFKALLEGTEMVSALQASLVRGWREGLDLGSEIPRVDHLVDSPAMEERQLEVLRSSLKKERYKKRLCGPFPTPIRDGVWFMNAWVSPYFVIPKKTPQDLPQRWRLIHHLSYHVSGNRARSLNGHIDLEEFPTVFPTHLTGTHLVF